MKSNSYKIDLEIYIVFIIVIGISVFNAIYSSLNISRSQDVTSRIITVEIPSLQALENMNLVVAHSRMYTTNWVYLRGNRDDKEKLKALHSIEYPELKGSLKAMMTEWSDQENIDSLNSVFISFERLMVFQKQIMSLLVRFDDYEDPMKRFSAEEIIESQILPRSAEINARLNSVIQNKKKQADLEHFQMRASSRSLMWSVLGIAILIIFVVLVSAFYMSNNIIVPTMKLKNYILQMGRGEIPDLNIRAKKNAVGQMTEAVRSLSESLRRTAHFAHTVGTSNFEEDFQPLSDHDELGNALIQMRASLKKADEENKQRNWINSGIARINEALRENTDDIGKLTDEIISLLVTYVRAYHGGIYLIEQSGESDNQWIELNGSYALDKRASAKKRFEIGEGLVGQAVKDGQTIHIRNIPNSYAVINSGLGESPATQILVVALKHHDIVYGAIELASFTPVPDFQIRFLESVGEIIASTIHSVKANTLTKKLLEETRKQAERLFIQEEELRNANDELSNQSKLLQISEEELKQSNQELKNKALELKHQNDILEQAQEALSIKARELELNSKYKSEFLANMSHELRTPLNSILILARLLAENKNQNLSEKQQEYSQVIYKSGNDLLMLINDILDLSKIEAGKIELIMEETSLKDIRKDLLSLFGELAIEKKISFDIEILNNLPEQITTDRVRLDQILKNLLSNAFKFTQAGGQVTLRIQKAGRREQLNVPGLLQTRNLVEFSVSDTGIGIPEEKQQLIFEAFQQADGSTNRKYGGTGLGLSISRMLVSMLGGEISLTSKQGKGSTFSFIIPLQGVQVEQSPNLTLSGTPLGSPTTRLPAETSSQKIHQQVFKDADDRYSIGPQDKVLVIVEDDIQFARILLDVAHDKEFKAIVATHGDEGLSYVYEFKPSAIILDMQLPGMDGWTVLQKIRQDQNLRNIPIHIMSAMDRKSLTMAMGATTYVRKPLDKKDLDKAFEEIEENIRTDEKKILLIGNSIMDQEIVSNLLLSHERNVKLLTADQSDDVLQTLQENKIDCIILDQEISSVQGKGFDTLERIRNNPRTRNTPIIVITNADVGQTQEARIKEFAGAIIQNDEGSYDRLLNETTHFLHHLENEAQAVPVSVMSATTQDSLSGRCALIADDDMRNLFALTSVLESHGLSVVSAMDGKEVMRKLEMHPEIEIVLTDIMMPEMDGYQLIQEIRSCETFKHLPVIAMTAKAMNGDRERCIQCGATDYISKPIQAEQLLSLLKIWLYKS